MGCGEPGEEALFEFLGSCADGAAVIGIGDFPQDSVRIASLNTAGVAWADVAVDVAVDEEDRNFRRGDRIFRRDLPHVEVILPSGVEESEFNDRA